MTLQTKLCPSVVAAIFAVPGVVLAQSTLPSRRPSDFYISMATSGGMRPDFTRMSCGASGCEHTAGHGAQQTTRQFAVSAAQLDGLYRVVRSHAFDRTRTEHHGRVLDGGGTSIMVIAAGHTYSFGASSNEGVAPRSRQDFDAVGSALSDLLATLQGAQPGPDAGRAEPDLGL